MEFPIENIMVVDCHDLDKYILEEYHLEVDVLGHCLSIWTENGQDSFIMLDVNHYGPESCLEIDSWTAEAGVDLIEQWLKGNKEFDIELVLWHLMHTGKIPEGRYLIKLWW